MELSPEEYGAYWGASARIAAGVLAILLGQRLVEPFLSHPEAGATALGTVVLVGVVFAGTYLVTLGIARIVRTAVDAEMRG